MSDPVDWALVFEFCSKNKPRFEEEDRKELTKSVMISQMSLVSGLLAGVISRYTVFKIPSVQALTGVLRFNISMTCLSVPPALAIFLAVRYVVKPAHLQVAEKYMAQGMGIDEDQA